MHENFTEIFRQRSKILLRARKDKKIINALKIFYRDHPAEFINDWGMTYNPQTSPSTIPLVLFPRQRDLINFFYECYLNREDGICEKCRGVGFTWLAVAFAAWLFLFHVEQKILFYSRKQDLVDQLGNPDSIFEKIRFFLKLLPVEFLPNNFFSGKNSFFMRMVNPENGTVIVGEAGENVGRGGRSSIVFGDEAAFWNRPQLVEAALSGNSDCKIYISTPNGIGNVFWQKRHSGKFKVFTFHWYDDLRKDKVWFDHQQDITDPVIFAKEVLIDYGASVSNVCIPSNWVESAVEFSLEGIEEGKIFLGLDVADEGDDANAVVIRRGLKVFFSEEWFKGTTSETTNKAYNIALNKNVDNFLFDSIGVGAGIRSEVKNIESAQTMIKCLFTGVSTAESPRKGFYEKSNTKNGDMFLNLRAQLWWELRRRFEKTFSHVNNIKKFPVEELISIPRNSKLITELSQPLFSFVTSGKIKIEAKADMKKRGIKSPNLADALMLSFAAPKDIKIREL